MTSTASMIHKTTQGVWLLAAILTLAVTSSAWADSGRLMPQNVPAACTQECAACHLAYPPGLLRAASP